MVTDLEQARVAYNNTMFKLRVDDDPNFLTEVAPDRVLSQFGLDERDLGLGETDDSENDADEGLAPARRAR